ncbi:MAG TPA: class I SAM-dependent methyltransferase [Candidatus Eisenbacteria bacterium]|nr:class I SAM-dependent methyltransferase [Candidatus Eisenbacteria bacterium]
MATFDERAREWDTPERIERAAEVAEVIGAAVPMSGIERAVEVGAGTGLLGLHFAGKLKQLLLTDPSAGMLEVAAEKVRRQGLNNVRTRRFDLTADALTEQFDLLLSLLMLHHVEDTAAALGAMRALLAPGGRIAVADLDTEDGSFHTAEAEGIHHLGFDRGDLGRLAAAAGFVDVAFRTAAAIEEDGRSYPVFLLTGRAGSASAIG